MSKVFTRKPVAAATAMAEIAEVGALPISKNDALDQPLANERARQGAGAALASMLIDETMQQAGKLKLYIQSLCDLDSDGRKGFRAYLLGVMKERRVLVKENGTAFYKAINTSAGVRLSEFKQISEALDSGKWAPDLTQNYHTIVGDARMFLKDNGKGETRGRKATHGLVKVLKYLGKLEAIDDGDKQAIAALLTYAEEMATAMGLAVDKDSE